MISGVASRTGSFSACSAESAEISAELSILVSAETSVFRMFSIDSDLGDLGSLACTDFEGVGDFAD